VVSGDSVQWSQDSSQVIFILAPRGLHEVAYAEVPGGAVTHLVTGSRQVSKLGTTGKHVMFLSETLDTPNEIYCTDWSAREKGNSLPLTPGGASACRCAWSTEASMCPMNGEAGRTLTVG